MSFETYWLVTPLALLGLSGFGWLALWLTRPGERHDHQPDRRALLEQTKAGWPGGRERGGEAV